MKSVIVHCSDTPNGRDDSAVDIHRWHQTRGWDGIGYHYVIRIGGTVEHGRPEYWQGAHCRGHNEKIGICLIGKDKFTEAQEDALSTLLVRLGLKRRTGCANELYGHYQLDDKKTCPNFDVRAWFFTDVYLWPVY